jgi:hypothetical protein
MLELAHEYGRYLLDITTYIGGKNVFSLQNVGFIWVSKDA